MKELIAVRADANAWLGMGHITRCLCVVNNLKKFYIITFYLKENRLVKQFINLQGYNVLELKSDLTLQDELDILTAKSPRNLILDIRGESNKYYSTYAEKFDNILRIDDNYENIYNN